MFSTEHFCPHSMYPTTLAIVQASMMTLQITRSRFLPRAPVYIVTSIPNSTTTSMSSPDITRNLSPISRPPERASRVRCVLRVYSRGFIWPLIPHSSEFQAHSPSRGPRKIMLKRVNPIRLPCRVFFLLTEKPPEIARVGLCHVFDALSFMLAEAERREKHRAGRNFYHLA